MYPCHSQMTVMTAMVFFAEIPEWQWHYDPALDSLFLTATSRMWLYIFFQRAFIVSVLSPFFDPKAPFDGIPLYMAHLVVIPPQMAPPIAVPPQPSHWCLQRVILHRRPPPTPPFPLLLGAMSTHLVTSGP